jgi:hypothetical protein
VDYQGINMIDSLLDRVCYFQKDSGGQRARTLALGPLDDLKGFQWNTPLSTFSEKNL